MPTLALTLTTDHSDDAVYAAVWTVATNWRAVTVQQWQAVRGFTDAAALAELDARIDQGVHAALSSTTAAEDVADQLAAQWRLLELPAWQSDPLTAGCVARLLAAADDVVALAVSRARLAATLTGDWPGLPD